MWWHHGTNRSMRKRPIQSNSVRSPFYLLLPTASNNAFEQSLINWLKKQVVWRVLFNRFFPTWLGLYIYIYPAYPLKKTAVSTHNSAQGRIHIINLLVLVLLESSIFTFLRVRVTGFLPMGSLVEECWTPQELTGIRMNLQPSMSWFEAVRHSHQPKTEPTNVNRYTVYIYI